MQKISIYLHFPFCLKKCNYCDFVSYPCLGDVADLSDYYIRELEFYSKFVGRRLVSSIYFGGGTPSLMSPEMIEKIIEKIYSNFDVADDVEITLEVNPKTVNEAKLRGFFTAGVNRLSIGIQSFDDDELRFLGRVHSAGDAYNCLDMARKYFDNISCDFIYALPNQMFEKWCANLEKIKALDVKHLSLYELIIEPKTPLFNMVKSGKILPVNERLAGKMFEYTNKTLRHIFPQYEISNYGKVGFESRHNLNYWNGGDYLGIGVSASGRICLDGKFFITENPVSVDEWKKNIDLGALAVRPLSRKKRAEELLIMGFRKNRGIDFAEFKQNSHCDFFDVVNEDKVNILVVQKYLLLSKRGIRTSVRGRSVLDAILREIVK